MFTRTLLIGARDSSVAHALSLDMTSSDDAAAAPATAPPAITVSSKFSDPRADIVLQSSDGVQYRVRRLYLAAGCGLFDDMFQVAEGGSSEGVGGLPVVELAEPSSDLDLFLPFLVRGQAKPQFDYDTIKNLLRLADK